MPDREGLGSFTARSGSVSDGSVSDDRVTDGPVPDGSVRDGLVIVDKPAGWTSHNVVGKIRRLAGTRKVGHAGTLDPMATGVLVCGLGRATRLLGHLSARDKSYLATIRLGQSTVTDDAEGEVVGGAAPTDLEERAVREVLAGMVGTIEQVPSAVSAVKIDGKRAYARVRAGEDVQLQPRQVTISEIVVDDFRRAPGEVIDVDVRVTCSSGTYVRAIARDLGATLAVGGHLTALRRTRVGAFDAGRAHTIEELEASLAVIPLSDAVRLSFPVRTATEVEAGHVRHGRAVAREGEEGLTGVFDATGAVLALMEPRGDELRVAVGFTGG
jgi:tRNA pseudouridine55 synthase